MPATHRLIQIKRRIAVFGFFCAMPLPQRLQAWLGAFQRFRMTQRPVSEQCGKVFGRSGGGDMCMQAKTGIGLDPADGPALDIIIEPKRVKMVVEQSVDVTMRRLLPYKPLYFRGKTRLLRFWQALQAITD